MKRFLQWLAFLEVTVVLATIIWFASDGLWMGLGRHPGEWFGMLAIFQIPLILLAIGAQGTPWPFKE